MNGFAGMLAATSAALIMGASAPALAQELASANVKEIEVDLDATALSDDVRVHRDQDVVETFMVFSNTRRDTAVVGCAAFDYQGRLVGRARVKIPGKGLRYFRASHLTHGKDVIGSASCRTTGHVLGSAILVGLGTTDLHVEQNEGDGRALIRFGLIATY